MKPRDIYLGWQGQYFSKFLNYPCLQINSSSGQELWKYWTSFLWCQEVTLKCRGMTGSRVGSTGVIWSFLCLWIYDFGSIIQGFFSSKQWHGFIALLIDSKELSHWAADLILTMPWGRPHRTICTFPMNPKAVMWFANMAW